MVKAVDLPLHSGKTPRWLFNRMVRLSSVLVNAILDEYGTTEFLHRISNPYWFQAFSLVLGFDWHSSGTTTTTIGALKEALNGKSPLFVAGGKGKTALKTLDMVERGALLFSFSWNKKERLKTISRLTAKFDSVAIQDGYNIYTHAMVFDEKGDWAVVQQGMNVEERYARRYHWHFNDMDYEHNVAGFRKENVLHFLGRKNESVRKAVVDAANSFKDVEVAFRMPSRHKIFREDLTKRDWEILKSLSEYAPSSFDELLLFKGFGAKKMRALALTASVVYGEELDWKDPVKYAYAHGGKDGIPYPVDKDVYDNTISFFEEVVSSSNLFSVEKKRILKKLSRLRFFMNGF